MADELNLTTLSQMTVHHSAPGDDGRIHVIAKVGGAWVSGYIEMQDLAALFSAHGHDNKAVLDLLEAAHLTKLDGIEAGATKNDTDANLKDRANHTGTQAIGTVTGLQAALDGKAAIGHGHVIGDVTGLQNALDNKLESLADDEAPQLSSHLDLNGFNIRCLSMPSDGKASAIFSFQRTAGESVQFPHMAYIKSDGKLWKASAGDVATAMSFFLVLESKSADEACWVVTGPALVRHSGWSWTNIGGRLYLSTTAGALTENMPDSTGDQIFYAGIILDSDLIFLSPGYLFVEHK